MLLTVVVVFFLLILIISGYMFSLAHRDHIRYDSFIHEKIPEAFQGFRVFLIADIHRRKIRQTTLDKVQETPDIVCIAGDLVERGVPIKRVRDNITALKKWHKPIYFVWGNNDYEAKPNELMRILKEEGVIILEDEFVVLEKENSAINLVGFDYYFDHFNEQSLIDWQQLEDTFTILLTHKPSAYSILGEEEKSLIDLVLAGHTHGGQIRLFGIGPYTRGGLFKQKKTAILITEGYGYSLLPLRLGTNAECHLLTLMNTSSLDKP